MELITAAFPRATAARSFCLIAFWAFLWNFALSMTFFPALLALDFRRSCAKRHGCCPCLITRYFCCCCACGAGSEATVQPTDGDESGKLKLDYDAPLDTMPCGSSECMVNMTRDGFATIIESAVLPVLLKPVGRVAIVFITVLLAVLTLTNMHTIGVGLSPTEVARGGY